MTKNRTQEVLYESEAALRLVDHELHEMHGLPEAADPDTNRAPNSNEASQVALILDRANAQILAVLSRLREGRIAIESTAVGKLQVTQDKIREVTSATEDAAINIMDACDRANQTVDELDAIDADPSADRTRGVTLRSNLRDELFLMMGALQFQDITSQQLNHASAVLIEMEQRLIEVAKLFDPATSPGEFRVHATPLSQQSLTYDVNASTKNSEGRQAVADEIFTVKGHAA